MAINDSLVIPATLADAHGESAFIADETFTIPTGITNGDQISLWEAPGTIVVGTAYVTTSGTLGASVTLRLRKRDKDDNTTNLAPATTAGSANTKVSDAPFVLVSGDTLEAVVGGADTSTEADVTLTLVAHRK